MERERNREEKATKNYIYMKNVCCGTIYKCKDKREGGEERGRERERGKKRGEKREKRDETKEREGGRGPSARGVYAAHCLLVWLSLSSSPADSRSAGSTSSPYVLANRLVLLMNLNRGRMAFSSARILHLISQFTCTVYSS